MNAPLSTETVNLELSTQLAKRVSEASVLMEGTPHPELADMLRVAASEMERLIAEVKRLRPSPPKPDCPYAAPFRYCNGCRAYPCPIGLDRGSHGH